MRLWHIDLLPKLPKQWLMGQHRECCALRGKGWGKSHATVNYVFDHSYMTLYLYHKKVMDILQIEHNVNIDKNWLNPMFRGKTLWFTIFAIDLPNMDIKPVEKYPEHDDTYLAECVENLKQKGIEV